MFTNLDFVLEHPTPDDETNNLRNRVQDLETIVQDLEAIVQQLQTDLQSALVIVHRKTRENDDLRLELQKTKEVDEE